VEIIEPILGRIMSGISQLYSDQDLADLALQDAEHGGLGRANTILALPLDSVRSAFLALPPADRYKKVAIENHELDESVLAILEGIDVPQYQRV
jgi:hypothetical protein